MEQIQAPAGSLEEAPAEIQEPQGPGAKTLREHRKLLPQRSPEGDPEVPGILQHQGPLRETLMEHVQETVMGQ